MRGDYYETGLLSACLISDKTSEVVAKVSASDFSPRNRPIFEMICDLFERGIEADPVTVWEEAERRELVGFNETISQLAELPPIKTDIDQYAKELKRYALARRLKEISIQISQWAMNEEPEAAYQRACEAITDIESDSQGDTLKGINEVLTESLHDIERRFEMDEDQFDGLPTGFKDIDDRWMGMKPGNLILIPGRPSMGKTTLAMNICEHNVRAGKSVLFFSLEMEAKELVDKTISSVGSIDFGRIMSGKMQEDDWPKLSVGVNQLKDTKLFIDDRHALTVAEMRAQAYRVKREHDLHLICVDYLQLMTGGGDNREQEISGISRGLKGLAKEMGIPVIAVAQLNRQCEARKNKRPVASDLRESGALEQDANVIAFVYRDEVYDENSPLKGTAEIITGKGRSMKVGTDCLAWRGQYQRFDNLDHRPDVESIIEQQESAGSRKREF